MQQKSLPKPFTIWVHQCIYQLRRLKSTMSFGNFHLYVKVTMLWRKQVKQTQTPFCSNPAFLSQCQWLCFAFATLGFQDFKEFCFNLPSIHSLNYQLLLMYVFLSMKKTFFILIWASCPAFFPLGYRSQWSQSFGKNSGK